MKGKTVITATSLLVVVLIFFVGCGRTDEEPAIEPTEQIEEAVQPVKEVTEEVYIEYMANHMFLNEKYVELMEHDPDNAEKYSTELFTKLAELPEKLGVTGDAINAYSEEVTADPEAYMMIVDRIEKRVQELREKDK